MGKQQDLTDGNILKGFVLFALPLFLGSLFQQLYGTVDLLFVGNFLGKSDAAAVGASGILVTCLIGLFTGISVGAGVVAAQLWGARNVDRVKACIENALMVGLLGGILLTAVGLLLSRQALIWLNTPENIMNHALIYIRIYLLSILPMIFYNMSAGILRATGDSRTPFLVLAAGGILNVFMDAFFIVILRWGVAGAAFATMVSQTFTAIVAVVKLICREKLHQEKWKPERALILKILGLGFPLGIQSMVLTLSNVIVQYYINGFGENTIAAFTVYNRVDNFVYLPIVAFGQAIVTFTGQNIGARRYDRIRRGALVCNVFSAAVVTGIAWLILGFGRQVLGLFCNDRDVIAEGLKIIRVTFPFYFVYVLMEVTGGIVRGAGKTLQSMAIVLIQLCVVRVIVLTFMVRRFHTITAVASVYPITWVLALISFISYYCYVSRMKKF